MVNDSSMRKGGAYGPPSVFAELFALPRASSRSATNQSITIELSRRGLMREQLIDPVRILLFWIPGLLLGALFTLSATSPTPGRELCSLGLLIVIGGLVSVVIWPIGIWLRRLPPIVVDATGIELQASGPVPWAAIDRVVIDGDRVWLDPGFSFTAGEYPPWFTSAHANLSGDGGGTPISVPLRWVDARTDVIADQIRQFARVPVAVTGERSETRAITS